VEEIVEAVRKRELTDKHWALLELVLQKVLSIVIVCEGKGMDLERLVELIPRWGKKKPHETSASDDGGEESGDPPIQKPPRRKGHGRNKNSEYEAAETVDCQHPSLRAKSPCPRGCGGTLYSFRIAEHIQLAGQALVRALRFRREVLRCWTCQETFTPPLPQGFSDEKYHPSLDACLAIYRYAMGLPLHRITQMLASMRVPLSASVQFERARVLARTLLPVFKLLEEIAAQSGVIFTDDTTARVLSLAKENETRSKKERTGVFATGMVALGEQVIVLFRTGRRHAGENLDRLLSKRSEGLDPPIHMCDALPRNESKRFKTILLNCLAHVVRKFRDVRPIFPKECSPVLKALGAVYHIDDETVSMTPAERLAHHQKHSGPIMRDLKRWIEDYESRGVEPSSVLGKAFDYVLNHWPAFTRFLEVEGAPLDNNRVERVLKMVIRHRKNSLFYKTRRGALVGDILMSVIRTCQENGVNPFDYLTDVGKNASAIKDDPEAWLPWAWAESRKNTAA
jgi:hypothetical protein